MTYTCARPGRPTTSVPPTPDTCSSTANSHATLVDLELVIRGAAEMDLELVTLGAAEMDVRTATRTARRGLPRASVKTTPTGCPPTAPSHATHVAGLVEQRIREQVKESVQTQTRPAR